MSLPLLEPFTGGAGVLADPPWSQQSFGSPGVTLNYDGSGSGKASAIAANQIPVFDDVNTYNNDQYAQVKVSGLASGTNYGTVFIRGEIATRNTYAVYTDGASGAGHTAIALYLSGTFNSELHPIATTFADGDTLKASVAGTVITVYKNGVSVGSYDTAPDATKLSSGVTGCAVQNSGSNTVLLDDFEGGNGTGSVPSSVPGDEGGYMPMAAPALGPNLLYY